ncbi:hypothetical protein ElyMa_001393100 [Elysia marginata]|uniref:Uncharacterized protein n=1 Tax=Elysia marginata TaxID=1093978 RepID=A0AAV4IRV6_9GAST|nr:hypothetical protein ElyMa_001393100 [Elysia marginata]
MPALDVSVYFRVVYASPECLSLLQSCICQPWMSQFTSELYMPVMDEGIVCQLRPDRYAKPLNFARSTGQSGGGICVIHRESLDMQCTALTTMTHFECCQCKLFINGRSLLLICIYRPPPSSKNKFTPKQFLA